VKYPYNVSRLTQEAARELLSNTTKINQRVNMILGARESLMQGFAILPLCKKVYPTDANFFLAEVVDADRVYAYLVKNGIIVRNRSHITLCGNCLRITIGSAEENRRLLSALRKYS
jgi:histidinol-phosphate aminotransferase